jgi:prolyl oligopeptidase
MEGKETHKFELPTVGTIASISGKKKHTDFFYGFTSFTYPVTFYHYDFTKSDPAERQKLFRAPTIKNFDSTAFETKQVFYESKDGTKIPMFLVMKKGLVQNGENPVFLYGYTTIHSHQK